MVNSMRSAIVRVSYPLLMPFRHSSRQVSGVLDQALTHSAGCSSEVHRTGFDRGELIEYALSCLIPILHGGQLNLDTE